MARNRITVASALIAVSVHTAALGAGVFTGGADNGAFNRFAQADAPAAPAPAPAAAPAPAGARPNALNIVITAVQGNVQVRQAEDQGWIKAEKGLKLNEGAEIRTGLRSLVQIKMDGGHTLTIDRFSTVKVLQAFRDGGVIKTDVGMKYGRVGYEVEAVGAETDTKVRGPGATLAVRGSKVIANFDELANYAQGSGKLAYLPSNKKTEMAFGGQGNSKIDDKHDSAADVAQEDSVVDPRGRFTGLTQEEFLNQLRDSGISDTELRGVLDLQKQLAESGGGGVGVPQLTGPLEFRAVWFTSSIDADIDISVTDPFGRTVSALNPVVGVHPADGFHCPGGCANGQGQGGFGEEFVTWPLIFNGGTHQVKLNYVSGSETVDVFLVATQGPDFLTVPGTDPEAPITLNPGQMTVINVTPSLTPPPPPGGASAP